MSELTISLSEEDFSRLTKRAARLRLTPEELVRASIGDLLREPEESFERIVDYVLAKNAELYRRLA
jgi:antitoxin FitA